MISSSSCLYINVWKRVHSLFFWCGWTWWVTTYSLVCDIDRPLVSFIVIKGAIVNFLAIKHRFPVIDQIKWKFKPPSLKIQWSHLWWYWEVSFSFRFVLNQEDFCLKVVWYTLKLEKCRIKGSRQSVIDFLWFLKYVVKTAQKFIHFSQG